MTEKMSKKFDNLQARDIGLVKPDVESQLFEGRRDGDSRNGRNLVPLVTVPENRRLSDRRPGFSHVGNEEKAAFVQKNQVSLKPLRFFLSVARSHASSGKWLSRPAGWLVSPASASSIPDLLGESAKHGQDDSVSRNGLR